MAVSLDKAAKLCPTAQGFQANRPGTCEDVSYAGVGDLAREYGEERFLYAIGNGPGRASRWGQDSSAAMDTSNDSHGFTLWNGAKDLAHTAS